MEEAVVQVLETGTDLTPVLEAMETVNANLVQLQANTDYLFAGLMVLCGIVVGVVVGLLLHDLWRA